MFQVSHRRPPSSIGGVRPTHSNLHLLSCCLVVFTKHFVMVHCSVFCHLCSGQPQKGTKQHRWGAPYTQQLRILFTRTIKTRRFEALSTRDFLQFLIVGILAGTAKSNITVSDVNCITIVSYGPQGFCRSDSVTDMLICFGVDLDQTDCVQPCFASDARVLYALSLLLPLIWVAWEHSWVLIWTFWCAGLFWLQAGQTNTVAGVNNLRGLLFFELMFMAMRAMLGALFTFPSEFKMMLKVCLLAPPACLVPVS